jgi:asparagine N-glycosylation enzyme membrane subunit Stt3
MKNKVFIILSFLLIQFNIAFANGENQDFMRSIGKMYVVVAVIATIFVGLAIFMVYMDSRISRIEKEIK